MTPPTHRIAQHGTIRLIPSGYHKPPVLRGLVDDDAEGEQLAAFEGLTNERLRATREGLSDLDPRELAYRVRAHELRRYGDTYVNAAFVYTREGGSRFNDERRGAWYCGFESLTALEEVAFHKARELANIGDWNDAMPYQSYHADFIGEFPNLIGVEPPPPCLDPRTDIGYPAGQALAAQLRAEGHEGLIYPSVRNPQGTCFVAFAPQIVQNVVPGARWIIAFEDSETPVFRTD